MTPDEMLAEIERLRAENERLKQELSDLDGEMRAMLE